MLWLDTCKFNEIHCFLGVLLNTLDLGILYSAKFLCSGQESRIGFCLWQTFGICWCMQSACLKEHIDTIAVFSNSFYFLLWFLKCALFLWINVQILERSGLCDFLWIYVSLLMWDRGPLRFYKKSLQSKAFIRWRNMSVCVNIPSEINLICCEDLNVQLSFNSA